MAQFLVFVSLYLNIVVLRLVTSAGFNIRTFFAAKSCNLQARMDAKCAELQPGIFRSIVECSARCGENCVGISFDENNQCYVHLECPDDIILATCSSKDQMFNLFTKDVPCFHKGVLNETSGLCECVGGWVGLHCERPPTSCEELSLFRYKSDKPLWTYIKVDSLDKPFKTFCGLNQGFITSRLMRNTGSLQPNRTWHEYVEGFYVNPNNFWVGLEKMKVLNTGNSTILRIDTQFWTSNVYNLFAYIYNNFLMTDSCCGYSFTFGTSGKTGTGPKYLEHNSSYTSCLAGATNVSFSTFDHDNNADGQDNCASLAGFGWWFPNCSIQCNPLGSRNAWLAMTGINLSSTENPESTMYFTTA